MKILIVALAAMLLAPSMALGETQTPGSNILVTNCYPHRHTMAQAHPWIDPYGVMHANVRPQVFPAYDGFLAITYKNQAAVAATEVDFGLVARGWLVAVARDLGTFSPEVTIDHEFVVPSEIFPLGTGLPACVVLRVKYADGSVWLNPTPPSS